MVSNVDVLGPLVVLRILRQCNRALIIFKNLDSGFRRYLAQLTQKRLEPYCFCVASDNAMYSATVDDSATVRCFLLFQLLHPPLIIKA